MQDCQKSDYSKSALIINLSELKKDEDRSYIQSKIIQMLLTHIDDEDVRGAVNELL